MPKHTSVHANLLGMRRSFKKALMVIADLFAISFSLWSSYALWLSDLWPSKHLTEATPLFISIPLLGVIIFTRLGLYRAVVRFMNLKAAKAVLTGVGVLTLALFLLASFTGFVQMPVSLSIIFGLFSLFYVGGSRLIIRGYYHWLIKNFTKRESVLIYGAGGAGMQLANMLDVGAEYTPIGFLDDSPLLQGTDICGLPVFSPRLLEEVLTANQVDIILLAMPRLDAGRRREILEYLTTFPVHVQTMPSMPDLISGQAIDDLRELEIEDLLGRDTVPPDADLIKSSVSGKRVLVTGAGGSIGSEIARQVMRGGAARVVILDQSEFALYSIDRELQGEAQQFSLATEIVPVLGSVVNSKRMSEILRHFQIQTVYHAAAYKHVPLVEHNVIEGVSNNSLGTLYLARSAVDAGVERFILISTDKAVRPTNVMGASKRLAEIALQVYSAVPGVSTVFSMVRFGNVLGSSGSVVPLFRKQILSGGPVTVTHPDITRFFMTIPEATSLVLQAASMATGGDVFVLDMGKPVRIVDLAERMIKLSGLSVKSEDNPMGQIAIKFAGLRPGEKLFEELLIGGNVSGTEHPKIMRAEESSLDRHIFDSIICDIELAVSRRDSNAIRDLLKKAVIEFEPSRENSDWLSESNASDAGSVSVDFH